MGLSLSPVKFHQNSQQIAQPQSKRKPCDPPSSPIQVKQKRRTSYNPPVLAPTSSIHRHSSTPTISTEGKYFEENHSSNSSLATNTGDDVESSHHHSPGISNTIADSLSRDSIESANDSFSFPSEDGLSETSNLQIPDIVRINPFSKGTFTHMTLEDKLQRLSLGTTPKLSNQ